MADTVNTFSAQSDFEKFFCQPARAYFVINVILAILCCCSVILFAVISGSNPFAALIGSSLNAVGVISGAFVCAILLSVVCLLGRDDTTGEGYGVTISWILFFLMIMSGICACIGLTASGKYVVNNAENI